MNKKQQKILIIEDDKGLTKILTETLSLDFNRVDSAETLDEAKSHLNDIKYDIILLDINLNNKNGAEVVLYLKNTPQHPNHEANIIVMSGYLTDEFIDKNKAGVSGYIKKPFQDVELILKIEEVLKGNSAPDEDLSPEALDEIQTNIDTSEINILDSMDQITIDKPFEIPPGLEGQVKDVTKKMRKHPGLKKLFKNLKVDRSTDKYYNSHIGLLVNIATGIAQEHGWNHDPYIEKIVFAAYLHDVPLAPFPHLVKVRTKEQLEQLKEQLEFRDDKRVLEHPNTVADVVENDPDIPPDVATIIRQHHELPDGSGFPLGIDFKRIHPMSALFIVSHDLCDHIIANPSWNLKDYSAYASEYFSGAIFSKIISALSKCR